MKWSSYFFKWQEISDNKNLFGATAVALGYAAVTGLINHGTELVGFVSILFLAAWLCRDGLKHALRSSGPNDKFSLILAWCVLLAVIPLLLFSTVSGNAISRSMILWWFLLAWICRFNGWKAAVWVALPIAACIFLVPFRTQLMLYISYPMRMISTIASAGFLGLFDPGIKYVQTTIHIPGMKIGITDACSGIAQVEAMLLLAYWVIGRWNHSLLWKGLHYLFLFPAIMIANGIRIIATILLFYWIGDAVFSDFLHILLGLVQVVVTMVIFFISGYVLPEKSDRSQEP